MEGTDNGHVHLIVTAAMRGSITHTQIPQTLYLFMKIKQLYDDTGSRSASNKPSKTLVQNTKILKRVKCVFGLNSIYFETIEKQYKYYTNLSCHGLCLLAVWPGKVGRGG